jgi:hypothetical protein
VVVVVGGLPRAGRVGSVDVFDFVDVEATPPLSGVGGERSGAGLAAGLVAEQEGPSCFPAEHLRNAKLVFRTRRLIDAEGAGIYRGPGPDQGYGGRAG